MAISPRKGIDLDYAFYWLLGIDLAKLNTGTSVPQINHKDVGPLVFPIPPIQEQRRIVTKMNELMTLCDELEQKETNHLKSHQLLVETLLGTLTQAKDATEFQNSWARLEQHFDDLLITEDSIDQLKQTILQMAVMGKLIPQDPKDEPASVLLKKIAKEKESLIEERKIKKQKSFLPIADDEVPYKLPGGWDWCRLGTITDIMAGASFKSGDFNTSGGIKCIKITNAGVGEFVETDDYLPKSFSEDYSNYLIKEGDLILALTRPYINDGLKISVCPLSYDMSLLNQRVAAIRSTTKSLYHRYAFTYLQSPYVLNYYKAKYDEKSQQPNMKMDDIIDLVFPFAPLSEQYRIVNKVDELFALCDRFKEKIQKSEAIKNDLANSVLKMV
jgi:type I restriction enzyme S subunit